MLERQKQTGRMEDDRLAVHGSSQDVPTERRCSHTVGVHEGQCRKPAG